MVGLFVRLKFRLLRNVLRTQAGIGLVLFTVVTWGAAVVAFVVVRTLTDAAVLAVTPVFAAMMTLSWLVSPLMFGASDETIDTTRLAMYDLDPRQVAAGMAAASVVGPGAVAALIPLLGVATTAPSIGHGIIAILAAITTIVMATTGSRLALTALGASLRRRRSRDLATVLAGVSVGVVGIVGQAVSFLDVDLSVAGIQRIADVAGLTPFGWAGNALARAASGEVVIPLVLLAAAITLIIVMLRMWIDVLTMALTEVAESDVEPALGGHLLRETAPRPHRLGWAVLAKERRYLSRHPRYRVQVLSQMIVLIIGGAPFIEAILDRNPSSVLLGSIPGLTAGITGSNLLGPDGRGLWGEALALRTLRPLLRGRSLLFVGIGVASSTVITLGVAAWTGGWRYVPVAIGAALAMALIGAGVGSITSTLAFATYPDEQAANPFASSSPGNGCVNGFVTVVGVVTGLLLSMPILFGLSQADESALAGVVLALGGPILGAAVWIGTTFVAGRRLDRRTPEIVAALSIA